MPESKTPKTLRNPFVLVSPQQLDRQRSNDTGNTFWLWTQCLLTIPVEGGDRDIKELVACVNEEYISRLAPAVRQNDKWRPRIEDTSVMVRNVLNARLQGMSGGFKGATLIMAQMGDEWWRDGDVTIERYPEANAEGYMLDVPAATARGYTREYVGALASISQVVKAWKENSARVMRQISTYSPTASLAY